MPEQPSRDELAARYIEQLPFEPYPVQEEALLAWFASDQGVLVCTPTGTGKTLIAEAALFEAFHTKTVAYYTTPLIALTEQKYREMQEAAIRWGFDPRDVGLVTGNRRENPDARILVVVAEILFNRLLHPEAFDFSQVSAVVMDEFHSFADPERGVVWELSLGLLPPHVRTLLLSATVGNARDFMHWLRQNHRRTLELVEGTQRRVPLTYSWVGDQLLNELLEEMAEGDDQARKTPALIFCFNREECWTVGEQLKGKGLLFSGQQAQLTKALADYDLSQGAGPKLRQLLLRGVGIHHAGLLPKYRRIVEELFQRKLLSVAVCTETLSAGINLPARSVVMPSIIKGPPGKKKVIEPSSAHQIFGRAGRPQYDKEGFVYVLAHDDDVKIARWKAKFDQIPEDTKDPGLLRMKKDLKRKMPKRRETEQYWTEGQFQKLRIAPAGKLQSRGPLPWRLLAYMLEASPQVEPIRRLVGKRLMEPGRVEAGQRELDRMLLTLWRAGYVELEPHPPLDDSAPGESSSSPAAPSSAGAPPPPTFGAGLLIPTKNADDKYRPTDGLVGPSKLRGQDTGAQRGRKAEQEAPVEEGPPPYKPEYAHPTPDLQKLMVLRSVNPLYGVFLVNQLGIASREERIQALESVLEMPRSVGHFVRVPSQDELPPGPLAMTRLDPLLLQLGLATMDELVARPLDEEEEQRRRRFPEERVWVLTLADKLRRLFDFEFPQVHDLQTFPVWAAGEVIQFGGDFNKYVTSKSLQKQEGLVFRHLLRLILLVQEFSQLTPPDVSEAEWQGDLKEITAVLTETCRKVDPTSTDKILEQAAAAADLPSEDV